MQWADLFFMIFLFEFEFEFEFETACRPYSLLVNEHTLSLRIASHYLLEGTNLFLSLSS